MALQCDRASRNSIVALLDLPRGLFQAMALGTPMPIRTSLLYRFRFCRIAKPVNTTINSTPTKVMIAILGAASMLIVPAIVTMVNVRAPLPF